MIRPKCDERKYISDREILEKYVYLENSCLTDEEKNQVIGHVI